MRRRAVALLVAGALLVLVPVGWWLTRPPDEEGGDTAERLARSAPSTPSSPPSSAAATGGLGTSRTSPPVAPRPSPAGPPSTSAGPALPVRLSIPTIGVEARVVPAGLDQTTGEMAVPRSVDVVGWYRFGPALAEPAGSTVIAGHVDDARQGAGAFFRLRQLGPGQRFVVFGGDGARHSYRVVAREVFGKGKVPLDRLFARDGAPRLTLITCGGDFDRGSRSYRDNIVVTAVEEGRR